MVNVYQAGRYGEVRTLMLERAETHDDILDQVWRNAVEKLDWQPIGNSHKDGRPLLVRSERMSYVYAYWGPNQDSWGWPESADDAVLQWRLAGDCRVGKPVNGALIEAAEPTDFMCGILGEY